MTNETHFPWEHAPRRWGNTTYGKNRRGYQPKRVYPKDVVVRQVLLLLSQEELDALIRIGNGNRQDGARRLIREHLAREHLAREEEQAKVENPAAVKEDARKEDWE